MVGIIKSLNADLGRIADLNQEELVKQVGFSIIPKNQFVKKFYHSKTVKVTKGKKTTEETSTYAPKKPSTSNLLLPAEREFLSGIYGEAWSANGQVSDQTTDWAQFIIEQSWEKVS
jgi:hypothetical protein